METTKTYGDEASAEQAVKDHQNAGYKLDEAASEKNHACTMTRGKQVVILKLEKVEQPEQNDNYGND